MYLGQTGSVRSLRLDVSDVAVKVFKLLHGRVKRHDPLIGGRLRVGRHLRSGRSDPETSDMLVQLLLHERERL